MQNRQLKLDYFLLFAAANISNLQPFPSPSLFPPFFSQPFSLVSLPLPHLFHFLHPPLNYFTFSHAFSRNLILNYVKYRNIVSLGQKHRWSEQVSHSHLCIAWVEPLLFKRLTSMINWIFISKIHHLIKVFKKCDFISFIRWYILMIFCRPVKYHNSTSRIGPP